MASSEGEKKNPENKLQVKQKPTAYSPDSFPLTSQVQDWNL